MSSIVKNISIKAISYYLPNDPIDVSTFKVGNEDWDIKKIISKTGIRNVHHASEDETALDMAIKSTISLFNENKIDRNLIDGLIFVTQSPDYLLPTSACILQSSLDLPNKTLAFDVNLGCSGFVNALSIATGLINTNICKNILIICAETYSKYINKGDRACLPIFSDGASSTLISSGGDFHIGPFMHGTDGSGAKNLIVTSGGARKSKDSSRELYMNGAEVFIFTLDKIPKTIDEFLRQNQLTYDDIDFFFFHQASNVVLDAIRKKCDIPTKKIINTMEYIGNTVSSTIPISLKIAQNKKIIKKDSLILLVGFGVGYSWGLSIIRWGSK